MSYPTVSLLGLPYLDATPATLGDILCRQLLRGTTPMRVFTPNATIAAAARKSSALTALLQQADLLLPDGYGVLLAAKYAGTALRSRLPGIDAAQGVLHLCAKNNIPVYLLGSAPGVAERAAANWKQRLPSLPVAGTHHGYFSSAENDTLIESIRASGAQVVLVCLGFPAQERWILDNAPRLPRVKLLMGLGGSFDVWAGQVRRAPRLWQRLGLEWLWRCARAPHRLRTLFPALSYLRAAKAVKKGKIPVKN